MVGSDLYKPLSGRPVRSRRRLSAGAVATVCCLTLGAVAGLVSLRDGDRGEPFAIAAIVTKSAEPAAQALAAPALSHSALAAPPDAGSAHPADPAADVPRVAGQETQIENGVTVVRATAAGVAGPLTLKIPDLSVPKAGLRLPDPQLIEASASGPLPRIGRDGQRPAAAYAAPMVPSDGKPRIAILIGGMGLDRAATAQAAATMPASVTFGFAPYGEDLDAQSKAVRAAGHEIVLQMPMEDFGRGDRPFPHMLKVDDRDNAASLRWLMSRFAGYAGVGNYLGGRLLADEETLKPLLSDIAARGLFFVDDGSAPRSLVSPVGRDLGLASIKADVVIDASMEPDAITAALSRLERLARERGSALGSAAARPATNDAIARFIAECTKRGIAVVPVSQAVRLGPRMSPQASR